MRARRHEARRVRAALLTRRDGAESDPSRASVIATLVGAAAAGSALLVLYLLRLAGI